MAKTIKYYRKKYNLYGVVIPTKLNFSYRIFWRDKIDEQTYQNTNVISVGNIETYEEAKKQCLVKLKEIINGKNI